MGVNVLRMQMMLLMVEGQSRVEVERKGTE